MGWGGGSRSYSLQTDDLMAMKAPVNGRKDFNAVTSGGTEGNRYKIRLIGSSKAKKNGNDCRDESEQ